MRATRGRGMKRVKTEAQLIAGQLSVSSPLTDFPREIEEMTPQLTLNYNVLHHWV